MSGLQILRKAMKAEGIQHDVYRSPSGYYYFINRDGSRDLDSLMIFRIDKEDVSGIMDDIRKQLAERI